MSEEREDRLRLTAVEYATRVYEADLKAFKEPADPMERPEIRDMLTEAYLILKFLREGAI